MRLWFIVALLALALVALLYFSGDGGSIYGSDADNVVRAIYLGLIGIAAGAALLGSGIRFGEASRNIAIWLAVAVAMAARWPRPTSIVTNFRTSPAASRPSWRPAVRFR